MNHGTLIGQGTVRGRFVGDNDTPATADQIKAMVSYGEPDGDGGCRYILRT